MAGGSSRRFPWAADPLDGPGDLTRRHRLSRRMSCGRPRRPLGVGYALRLACGDSLQTSQGHLGPVLMRWLRGGTTDADRLALARALREVFKS